MFDISLVFSINQSINLNFAESGRVQKIVWSHDHTDLTPSYIIKKTTILLPTADA